MYIPRREAQDLAEFPLKLTPKQTVTYITLWGLCNRGLPVNFPGFPYPTLI